MDILLAVGENERAAGRQVKYKVYVKAVNSIAAYPTRITSGAEARKLDGIGEKIAAKIDEILQTGELQKLEQAKKDPKQQGLVYFPWNRMSVCIARSIAHVHRNTWSWAGDCQKMGR
jgi:DNA polymerase/3'-5' exonuclease PolX